MHLTSHDNCRTYCCSFCAKSTALHLAMPSLLNEVYNRCPVQYILYHPSLRQS